MKNLINFFGLKRSGNHAIINWLKYNIPRKYRESEFLHINNAYDIYEDPPKIVELENLKSIDNERTYLSIISYEDVDLTDITKTPLYKNQDKILPGSIRKNILLLRDPFNLFASRLKMLRDMKKQGVKNPIQKVAWNKVKTLWKQYAREFLGKTSFLGKDKIIVNYDLWIVDKKYRNKLLWKNFSRINKDINIDNVLPHGGGSSFDYVKYHGRAIEMDLLNRWQYFTKDEFYLDLIRDKELIDLSKMVFRSIINFDKMYHSINV